MALKEVKQGPTIPPDDEWAKEAALTYWWGDWRDPQPMFPFLYEDQAPRHKYPRKDNWHQDTYPVAYDSIWAEGRQLWEIYLDAFDSWMTEVKRLTEVYKRASEHLDAEEAEALEAGKFPSAPIPPQICANVFKHCKAADVVALASALEEPDADVNMKNQDQMTPLMFSAQAGSLECVEYLCDFGADVTFKNKDGDTAFDIAIHSWAERTPDHPVIAFFRVLEAPRGDGWKAFLRSPTI
jgi:hypothetical protein